MTAEMTAKSRMKGISASVRARKKELVECRPVAWSRRYTARSLGNSRIWSMHMKLWTSTRKEIAARRSVTAVCVSGMFQ